MDGLTFLVGLNVFLLIVAIFCVWYHADPVGWKRKKLP